MPKPDSTNAGKRFQLPALDFKFGSLTDGTDIPPPLPSPVEKTPPKAPEKAPEKVPEKVATPPKTPTQDPVVVKEKEQETNGHVNGSETSPKPESLSLPRLSGVKRPAEDGPASPTESSRGSLRRLLSKSLLNKTYNDQASVAQVSSTSRPPSRTASTMTEERKSKRSSGWFRRLRHHDSSEKRMSQQFAPAPAPQPQQPTGPPPPMIPELSALQTKVDTNIGDDIFKSIK